MTIIRKATKQDFLALHDIELECFKSDLLSKRSLRNFINHKQHLFLVASQGKKIVGYLITLLTEHHRLARHYSLAVLPQYRRQSIGRKLLLASEAHFLAKQGVKLEIRVDNDSALKLYQSLGYKSGKIKPAYYQDGCGAMEMIKFFRE